MPTVHLAPIARKQYLDSNGDPVVGGKLFTYAAGSSTKQTTYTDSTGTTANSNPIILDASGRTPNGVWYTAGLLYKEVLALATDTDPPTSPIYTADRLEGVNDTTTPAALASSSQWVASGMTPTYVSATQFTVVGDQTAALHVGRRVRCTVTAGTVYGRIRVTAFTTLTTVTVVLDSGALDSGLSAVDVGIITALNTSMPELGLRKNIINNGGFSINQRVYISGTAVGTGLYGHDRWKMAASGDTYSFSTASNKTTVTIGAGKVLQQVVEGLNLQSGTYTLSWEGTAQGKIGAGALSASGVTGSITGGTNTTIEFGPGTLANVQLEFGTVATPFEFCKYSAEIILCQRYFQLINGTFSGFAASAASGEISVPLYSFMRATPTMTNAGNGSWVDGVGAAAVTNATLTNGFSQGPQRVTITSTGMTATNPILVVGQTLAFSAEL